MRLFGDVWSNCTTDVDCPGLAKCFENATWAAFPRMCSCDPGVLMGSTCMQRTPTGDAAFAVYIIIAIISAVSFLSASGALVALRLNGVRLQLNALHTTLAFSAIAGFWITVLMATQLDVLNPQSPRWTVDPTTGSKELPPSHLAVQTAALSLVFFFLSAAMLNTSLVWIQVSDSAKTLSTRAQRNVCLLYTSDAADD